MRPTVTIDIGTTSVKLCLFDAQGALLASDRRLTPTLRDDVGDVYDLDALLGIVSRFLRGLEGELVAEVQRIAITGVGESGGLVRSDLSLASPMILWHDQRGAARLVALTDRQRDRIYRVTGLPVSGNYGLSKVAWACERLEGDSDVTWLNVSEYLAALMTGERWSEYSLASRTMALDLGTGSWSEEVCGFFGVGVEVFPPLRRAAEGSRVTERFARENGLPADVEVHVVGHDHMVGAAGADLRPGELLNSTGTTEGLLFVRDAPALDARARDVKLANGFDCRGARYTLFASIPTGGAAFATLQTMLGMDAGRLVAVIDELHARYLGGGIRLADVPLVLPRFRGAPPPSKRTSARGLMAGIRADTTAEEIVFGTFLGMVRQFRDVLGLFPEAADGVKVIGPAGGNLLWQQLKADLLGVTLSAARVPEIVSRGAQALASGGRYAWADCDPLEVDPDEQRHRELSGWEGETRAAWQHLTEHPA